MVSREGPPPPFRSKLRPLGSLWVGLQLPGLEGELKETPFRPPQPCPPPSRTPPLSPGLSTAPVPAAPLAAHSNLLRNGHVDRGNPCPQGGPPRSVCWSQKSRSCRTSGQATTRAAPAARGRGTADATRWGPLGRGMGRRPRARSSPAGRGTRRVPVRCPALLGAATRPRGSSTCLLLPFLAVPKPCRQSVV